MVWIEWPKLLWGVHVAYDLEVVYRASASGTKLVSKPGDDNILAKEKETDVRTAITRALAEYLRRLDVYWAGGRYSRFAVVAETWAEPEDAVGYPGAAVWTDQPGLYDDSRFTPRTFELEDKVLLREISEFTQVLKVELFCTDKEERMALVSMLEDAFDPVDWMSGFVLEAPHYHNARITYEKTEMGYLDSAAQAEQRARNAVFTLNTSCPQYRLSGVGQHMNIRIDTGDVEGGVGEIGPEVEI